MTVGLMSYRLWIVTVLRQTHLTGLRYLNRAVGHPVLAAVAFWLFGNGLLDAAAFWQYAKPNTCPVSDDKSFQTILFFCSRLALSHHSTTAITATTSSIAIPSLDAGTIGRRRREIYTSTPLLRHFKKYPINSLGLWRSTAAMTSFAKYFDLRLLFLH